jgi:predicted phosphoribosyltransferase
MLTDRTEAGRKLAERLRRYAGHPTAIVLGMPRGGVAVAAVVAEVLQLPLDVYITRKLGAPWNPEYALGALAETGTLVLNDQPAEDSPAMADIARLIASQRARIDEQISLYRQGRPLPSLAGRPVILVDDGVATGATFVASVRAIRAQQPERVVAAIPVGPRDSLERIAGLVDELVVLEMPDPFWAVGQAYERFDQLTDDAVTQMLEAAAARCQKDLNPKEQSYEGKDEETDD